MKYLLILPIFAFFVECEPKNSVSTTNSQETISISKVDEPTKSSFGFKEISQKNKELIYPQTSKGYVVDNYFGQEVSDPYRWLEDDNSPETLEWVRQQNEVTSSYMSKVEYRDDLRNRLEQLYDYTKYGAPFKEGENYFYFKKEGLQNQSVLYISQSIEDEGKVFLDPNTLSADGTVAISTISISNDGKLFAYAKSEAGSDWKTLHVKDIETGKDLDKYRACHSLLSYHWYTSK